VCVSTTASTLSILARARSKRDSGPAIAVYGGVSKLRVEGNRRAYAKAAGYEIVKEFYDAAVSGADPVSEHASVAASQHNRPSAMIAG
jgi:hypothetical protein